MYQMVDFNFAYNHANNNAARLQRVPTFMCPSDSFDRLPTTLGGPNSYYANSGTNILAGSPPTLSSDPNFGMPECNGVFYRDSRVRPADIIDGLSNTVAFSERIAGDGNNAISTSTDTFQPARIQPTLTKLGHNAWRSTFRTSASKVTPMSVHLGCRLTIQRRCTTMCSNPTAAPACIRQDESPLRPAADTPVVCKPQPVMVRFNLLPAPLI